MNLLDVGILIALGVAAFNGFRRGAVLQLATYAGLIVGLFAGALLAPAAAGLVESPLSQAAVALVVLLSLAAVGDAVGWLVGRSLWTVTRASALAPFDAVGGVLVSAVAVLVAVWFVAFNLTSGPIPPVSRAIGDSAVIRVLDSALPRPPAVLAQVRQFLNRFGFPEVFAELPPAPAGPVRGPTGTEVEDTAFLADQSTLKIVGEACVLVQEGTGFVGAPNYVITNAHVVAGVRSPTVQQQNGSSQRAIPVVFDPKLDIAVLYVEETPGPPLRLADGGLERGTVGAVLGFPGGGGLQFGPAAVRRSLSPIGRDIYGDSLVRRDVYELQADVRPGNSGGPFVLTSGEIGGVVFAASTADPGVGYAITSSEVMPLLQLAQDRTRAVSTGGCIR